MTKISQQLKMFFSRRGRNFADEIASAIVTRTVAENPSISAVNLAAGAPSEQNALLAALAAPQTEVSFIRTGTVRKAVVASGSVVVNTAPVEGEIVSIWDGVSEGPTVFEFDAGDKATGTLTLSGQPADTNTFTLDDGTTSKVIEFDSGVAGVRSSGGVLTLSALPSNNDTITMLTTDNKSVVFQFKTSGLADVGKKIVSLRGQLGSGGIATAKAAALELIKAINGTGTYAASYPSAAPRDFLASSGGDGIVNVERTKAGAGHETISTSVTAGVNQVETATVAGTIGASGAGNATVIVTAAGMTGSPITTSVAVANDDTATLVAGKIRTALGLVANITAKFTVGGTGVTVTLTALSKLANDATLNISVANGTCSGLTNALTSANTTAGVAPSGSGVVVTSSFSGGVTAIAAGSNITGGHVGAAIGLTGTAESVTNLIAAINSVTAFLFVASQGTGLTVTLTAKTAGTAANAFTMAKSGSNLAVSGGTFTGGHAAGSGSVGAGHVAVALSTANGTATALHTAINAAAFDIVSTNSPAGTCALVGTLGNGALSNELITTDSTHLTVAGLTGGVSSSADLIDDDEVGDGRAVFVSSVLAVVNGATDWADATALVVEDTDGVDFVSFAQADLTDSAVLAAADGTLSDAFKLGTGGTEGKGLRLAVTGGNEETGSDVVVTVSGIIKGV